MNLRNRLKKYKIEKVQFMRLPGIYINPERQKKKSKKRMEKEAAKIRIDKNKIRE